MATGQGTDTLLFILAKKSFEFLQIFHFCFEIILCSHPYLTIKSILYNILLCQTLEFIDNNQFCIFFSSSLPWNINNPNHKCDNTLNYITLHLYSTRNKLVTKNNNTILTQ